MPRSKRRKKPAGSGPRIPAEQRVKGRRGKRIGWILAGTGILLFFLGNIGARTGLVILPFDPHHMYTQIGGGVLAIAGTLWATRR